MRQLIIDIIMSLDGYYTDLNNNIDWFDFSTEEQEWSKDILRRADTLVFGRRTYEEFSTFWPTPKPEAIGFDPYIIQRLNEMPKIIFSKSLTEASWKPSTIMKDENLPGVISKLKNESGKCILVIGSGSLVAALAKEGLVDEYRIRIRPIILGAGKPLFIDRNARHPLELVSSQAFNNGVLGLHYKPIIL
ncbi:MAG: dihydrofolate reductase family protein [Thaumarchaeota archaeon]|nr:dihydrofolate reductase family protein [Nitrososphaerota archaeon]